MPELSLPSTCLPRLYNGHLIWGQVRPNESVDQSPLTESPSFHTRLLCYPGLIPHI